MAERQVRITLRDKQTTGGSIPGSALFGEPFVNLFDGILKFSGVTGGSFETSDQVGVFEVGSRLYNQKISNRLSINDNFIISGATGLISTYGGVTGVGLNGKFLSGTTNGFVLGEISDIRGITTRVQSGVNIYTGGTADNPTVNLVDSPSVNNFNFSGAAIGGDLSAVNISGGTIYSGSTNLYDIFLTSDDVSGTTVSAGSNVNVQQTGINYEVSVVPSPSFNQLTTSGLTTINSNLVVTGLTTMADAIASNMSATTYYSGSTNLESVIYNIVNGTELNDITRVQPGTNITTGGTANNPTINLVSSPSVDNITFSGTAIGGDINAVNISGTTLYSGGTNLEQIIKNNLDTYVTGLTYNNANILTIKQNQNKPDLNVTINTVSGLTNTGNLDLQGQLSNSTGNVVINDNLNITGTTTSWGDILPGTNLGYDLGASGQRWDELWVRRVNIGTSTTVIEDNLFSSTTGNMLFDFAGDLQVDNNILPLSSLTYNLGSNLNRWNNIYTKDLDVSGAINATGITVSGLLAGSVVYVGAGGELKTETGFAYNDSTDTFSTKYITVGTPGQTGTTAVIHGDVLVIGESISGFTSQLYIEDNLIELNYNPTGDTSSSSLGAGWSIQDGSGVAGTDVFFDIRGTGTGLSNRSFATNLEDIRIRETGTVSLPNGKYVLASDDILDGGSY